MSTVSSPARVSIASVSFAPSVWEMLTFAGRPVSVAVPATTTLAGDRERVVAVGAGDRDAVRLTVAAREAESRGEADVDERDRRAAEVADRERVGAAARERVDLLEVGQLHRDVPDVAREAHAPADRRHVERLGGVLSEEEQRVAARAAVDVVAAVARRPAEAVEVAAEAGDVVALAALDVVEVGAADRACRRRGRRARRPSRRRRRASAPCRPSTR